MRRQRAGKGALAAAKDVELSSKIFCIEEPSQLAVGADLDCVPRRQLDGGLSHALALRNWKLLQQSPIGLSHKVAE